MPIRKSIFIDDETWSHLKAMSGSDMRSTSNFLQVLVKQEWEARLKNSDKPASVSGNNISLPKIPPDFHITQI